MRHLDTLKLAAAIQLGLTLEPGDLEALLRFLAALSGEVSEQYGPLY